MWRIRYNEGKQMDGWLVMTETTDDKKRRLSTSEAALLAGVNVSYIRRLVSNGTIRASKLGGRYWMIERADLVRWMAERKDG